jgi:transposase
MSTITITPFYKFSRMKITEHHYLPDEKYLRLSLAPDARTTARCPHCGAACPTVHSWYERPVRDLDLADCRVVLDCRLRKTHCTACGSIVVEACEAVDAYKRVTPRMALYVHGLCKWMSLSDAARHVGLDWKTVRDIDKAFLEKRFSEPDYSGLRVLAVDEIAVKKGHRYMTVVLDYLTGRVVWMGEDRKQATLEAFFDALTPAQRAGIIAIAMDMWPAFIAAAQAKIPQAAIVFDPFHVIKMFGKVIDDVRIAEAKAASETNKDVYKGTKYLLLKNRENLTGQERERVKELLALNETLCMMDILREKLKKIWTYRSRGWAARALDEWCALALSLNRRPLTQFVKMLQRRRAGILNHCRHPIHTSKLEGVNNKIKVIKRKAYGFHDLRYFQLKVYQAFAP